MSMSLRRLWFAAAVTVALVISGTVPAWAQATGTVAGTVHDAQGGAIPGATVTLVSQTRGTTTDVATNERGDFVIPNMAGDTYTVRVTMDGFKTLERPNVSVSPGDRVAVGTLTIEVGALAETVTVAGEAPMIQSQSGERSFTATTEAVQNLPISNRNFASFTAFAPGVSGTTRLGNAGQNNANNFMVDGVSIMDTGNNGQMLQTNVDAIAEVKVLTSGYQAEYGRSSGLQITAVTKSGSNQFRGSVYDIQRHSRWDANSWANVRNGIAKSLSDQHDRGYTIGGPIGKPGGKNKLFFFYAHEYRPRVSGGGTNRFRVPTALERAGDFSQSTDNNGNLFNLIRDASTGLPCTAADTRGCFADGGVLGRIPANRLYGPGLNILNLWPAPNTTGLDYNLQLVAPLDKRLTQQPTVRVDYQWSSRLRVTGKYTGQLATVKPTAGSIPGFNDTLQKYPFIYQPSATVDYTLNSTTFVEATWGFIQNQLGTPIISNASNKCNVGLCDLPVLFPDANIINPDYYNYQVLQDIGTPMLVDGRIMLPPTFTWTGGSSRVSNGPPSLIFPSFLNLNHTHNVSASVTRLMGRHTAKAGLYFYTAYKAENFGLTGAIPFNGQIDFRNDTNNPIDAGFPYANAALGIFSSYAQQSKFVQAGFRYKNIEWYFQDNWKVNSRLTLDYGLRFTHQQPQYDSYLQASNFFPEKWSAANAPFLYTPGCATTASPCPTANRTAVNPLTGASLGAGTSLAIGTLVPNTGNPANGVIQAGQGIAKENYVWPSVVIGPRFGAAYDLTGSQTFVFRGNVGLFYDRPEGNATSNQIGNLPYSTSTTVRYAQLQTLGSGGLITKAPGALQIYPYTSDIPSNVQWSGGVQIALPWASALDVSYVGNHGYNTLQNFSNAPDINSIDFGAAYLAQNQDPTLSSTVPGAAALSTDLLRPLRGFGSINLQWPHHHTTYHSIQTSLNRRFRNGLQFGLNYTFGISNTGNLGAGVRLQHDANGNYSVRDDQATLEDLFNDVGNRRHTIKGNAIWDLPDVHIGSSAGKIIGAVVNDWQLSGVLTAGSAAPYDISYSYNTGGAAVNLTGTPSYNARIKIVGDTGGGCSSDQYKQFNVAAFAGPGYNSLGLESGRNYMSGCPDHTIDLAIARNIRVGKARQVQFRLDMFNAFNTVVFSGRQTQLQLNSPTDLTVRNPQFNADGSLATTGTPAVQRTKPTDAGFGAVTGAQAMRTLQAQIRFQF